VQVPFPYQRNSRMRKKEFAGLRARHKEERSFVLPVRLCDMCVKESRTSNSCQPASQAGLHGLAGTVLVSEFLSTVL
jgi:hypothetical protein